jgi:hypothetical protein
LFRDAQPLGITGKMVNNQDSNFNPNVPTLKQVRDRLGMTQEQLLMFWAYREIQLAATRVANTGSFSSLWLK